MSVSTAIRIRDNNDAQKSKAARIFLFGYTRSEKRRDFFKKKREIKEWTRENFLLGVSFDRLRDYL